MVRDVVIVTVHGTRAAKFEHPKAEWWQRAVGLLRGFFYRSGNGDAADAVKDGPTGRDPPEPMWWHPASNFCNGLLERICAHGMRARIESFEWSGANSGSKREEAAIALKRRLKRLARPAIRSISWGTLTAEM
jgi:predicted Fe-S protein YdhL (DUF1289 family)